MILVCPACRTRYKVDDEAVNRPSGRTVRCAACGHSWHYPAAPPVSTRLHERPPAAAEPAPFAVTPRPAITVPSPPRHRRSGWAWLLAIVLLGGALAGALIFGHDRIVAMWPQAQRLYGLAGLGGEPLGMGLDIGNINSTRNSDGLVVEGDITNKTGVPRSVPRLRIALRDAGLRELVFKIVAPPRERLLPGETSHFVVGFLPAPDAASGVLVTFTGG